MNNLNYENTEIKLQNGGKIVRKVSIKNGKGYKSVTKFRRGKKVSTVKKPIHSEHINLIKKGKFIPGLFEECKNSGCKVKRGGQGDEDIEIGKITDVPYMKYIPPDPKRFENYQDKIIKSSLSRPISPVETEKMFEKGPPEKIQEQERMQMVQEDPLNMDPFDREPLQIFSSEGGKSRKRLMMKSKRKTTSKKRHNKRNY
jgi:hypothetical protein